MRRQSQQHEEVDTVRQLRDFWNKVGVFSRICFIINVAVYIYQYANYKDSETPHEAEMLSSICLGPITQAQQFYRIFTSEFTHGNIGHIVMNMCGLLLFGVDVEKKYGSSFYLMINFMLMMVSIVMSLSFYAIMIYLIPVQYRGGPENFYHCGVGYSNILFGIAMIFSYVGEPQMSFFGLCKIDKKYLPWFYMLCVYFTIPDSSFMGHFCGLIAGLMIKFCGLYILFPKYEWIASFDRKFSYKLQPLGYFEVNESIMTDFDSYMWNTIIQKIRHWCLKIRHRLFGYEYVPQPPDPIICPDSIEMIERNFH